MFTLDFIKQTLKNQLALSEKTRLRFEESGMPKVVFDYIKKDFTGERLREPWIMNVIANWKRNDRGDLISKLFAPPGRAETAYPKLLENLIFVDRIERYRTEQGSLKAAIYTEMERIAGAKLSEIDERLFEELKNCYERFRKIPTICRVIENHDSYELYIYGCRISIGENSFARCTMKYQMPK
jgi:hypothetical protein